MRKKTIVSLSIIVGLLLAVILVSAMVFTLRQVNFCLTTQITQENRSHLFEEQNKKEVEKQLYTSANFEKGGNLLFLNFDRNIKKMEKAVPFVKIEKVVRRFPNRITVYYSEREAVALIPVKNVSDAYYVVDTDLKVLDYVTSQTAYNLPVVNFYGKNYQSSVGSVIADNNLQYFVSEYVSSVFSAYGHQDALYEDVMKTTKSISVYNDNVNQRIINFTASITDSVKIYFTVIDATRLFFEKVSYGYQVLFTNLKDFAEDKNILVQYGKNPKTDVFEVFATDTKNSELIQPQVTEPQVPDEATE